MKKEKNEPQTNPESNTPKPETAQPERQKEVTIEEKLLAAEKEIYELKNKYAMVYADMDNLRKSQDRSFAEALRYRAEGFVDKLLPALDAFHIALKNPVDDPKVKNYLIGFDYIFKQIQQALEDEGVKEIPIKLQDPFDVKTMHAIESEVKEGPPNRVIRILSSGYRLHERVVKQSLVIVSKEAEVKPKEAQPSSDANKNDINGKKAA
jgi:molecular chaperone GrpE